MEKVCCEVKCGDDFEMKCVETDDGYRIEVKGDKEKLKAQMKDRCCGPFGGMQFRAGGESCC